ncbi:calcium/proton exchanger [Candidozyma auris]|uniref:Calcium/proton exchanger n=1 Tax=Candidozyma auris TaxID=498019 RepID=A0A2H1A1E9_CANAR|nr:calcium/proton exchanger [[Candida] auris]PIS56714.1 calcium/proton exchanger [[Candida] auris]
MSERTSRTPSRTRNHAGNEGPERPPATFSTSTLSLPSPQLKPRGKLRKHKSRPHIRRGQSGPSKLVFSVDDDIYDEIDDEDDSISPQDKRYLEGYHDAIKKLYSRKKSLDEQSPEMSVTIPRQNSSSSTGAATPLVATVTSADSAEGPQELPDLNEEDFEGVDVNDDDAASQRSSSSSQTVGSLNLKDRQDAINSTHPFGIKIWKPSIYKKNRSVAARADEDIHDFDPRKPAGKIYWGVHVSNMLWSLTFGVVLYLLCMLGAVIVFVLSGFAWHKHSRPYVRCLLKLGRYWLYPFGKFVLLNKDKNYLEEDELDGRSIYEFHKWRQQEEGRLFFAPPRRLTGSGQEGKPLLKDHKGRPWQAAYSSLGDESTSNDAQNNNDASQVDESAIDDDNDRDEENDDSSGETEPIDIKRRLFGRGAWSSGRFMFYVFFYGIMQPILYIISLLSWLFVFTIPIANLTMIMCDHLRRRPLALHYEKESTYYKKVKDPETKDFFKNQSIILCTYRSCGLHYYKYTIDGTNIFFINLLAVVVFVILDFFLLKETFHWDKWYTNSSFLFCMCLFSIIPLAYFIGQAVASISAQSSMGVGAVINAFFSTIVEIFLYCVALNQGKGKLVEGSMIGSILAGVLLLPGLSMCGGAIKRKTQRYNPRSAGVSSTMLLYAMVTMFTPSLFYQMYGSYEIRCKKCEFGVMKAGPDDCTKCRFIQPSFALDKLYYTVLRPFSVLVACALFLAYVCGLFFTLRTHASLIWATNSHEPHTGKKDEEALRSPSIVSLDTAVNNKNASHAETHLPQAASRANGAAADPNSKVKFTKDSHPAREAAREASKETVHDEEGGGGHDAPNWSRNKSTVILLGATLLYAVIAEILVDNVDEVLESYPINPKFLGLTVFALVPNTTEFVNAISFAIGGNVALSMEIGSAYALQVVLIQIPCLVIYSIVKQFTNVEMIFSLIFPRWDIMATLISIYLFTYIYAEGKSNYFKGVILCLIYSVVLVGFFLDDKIEELDDGYRGTHPSKGHSSPSAYSFSF